MSIYRQNDERDYYEFVSNIAESAVDDARRAVGESAPEWPETERDLLIETMHQEGIVAQATEDAIMYTWRQRQIIRWSDNIDAYENNVGEPLEPDQALQMLSYWAVVLDIEEMVARKVPAGYGPSTE